VDHNASFRTIGSAAKPSFKPGVFGREDDGLRAVALLSETWPVLQYHGVDDGTVSALSISLEHALDRTLKARERVAHGG
jgi:hypothetical protein